MKTIWHHLLCLFYQVLVGRFLLEARRQHIVRHRQQLLPGLINCLDEGRRAQKKTESFKTLCMSIDTTNPSAPRDPSSLSGSRPHLAKIRSFIFTCLQSMHSAGATTLPLFNLLLLLSPKWNSCDEGLLHDTFVAIRHFSRKSKQQPSVFVSSTLRNSCLLISIES